MRRHLHDWGSELEGRVRERTQELEIKHNELREVHSTLQEKERQLRLLLGKGLGAQEDERKRVSRELHDGIGQALTAMSMGLETLDTPDPNGNGHDEQVELLKETVSNALRDLRRMTVALRPAALDDLGLMSAIRRYAQVFSDSSNIRFEIEECGIDQRLEPSLETVVYRVVQEAVNNAVRHSEASCVDIRFIREKDALVVTVEDDGKGFDLESDKSDQGVGIQGMYERASMVGGRLDITSKAGRGTTVRLTIDLGTDVETSRNTRQ